MLGAIVGDIVGSPYEFHNIKRTDFPFLTKYNRFTDDSVMTLANAKWLTEDPSHSPEHLVKCMRELGRAAQGVGYGPAFLRWLYLPDEFALPYNSWGNGAGMRVSPVGMYAKTLEECLALAKISAEVTHNHPEGIKGAQAIATCVFLARTSKDVFSEDTKSGQATPLMSLAKGAAHTRSGPTWKGRTSRTPFVWPFPSAAILTQSPA